MSGWPSMLNAREKLGHPSPGHWRSPKSGLRCRAFCFWIVGVNDLAYYRAERLPNPACSLALCQWNGVVGQDLSRT